MRCGHDGVGAGPDERQYHGRRWVSAPNVNGEMDPPRRLRKLDNFDFLFLDDLGYLPQGAEESEVLFTLVS